MESTLQSKRMLLGRRKCYPRAKMLPNSTELSSDLLSLPKPSLICGLCMLALFISCDCSGPCTEDNYSNADRRSVYSHASCCVQIWKQDSLPKPQGHIRKVRPSSCIVPGRTSAPSSSSPFLNHARFCFDSDIHYNRQTALQAKCLSGLSQVPLTGKQ